ncbi:MAG: hypothetical protein M3Z27_04130 [Actinomycetota bacterium]|nr:hypothetical protein [Actinomycetota bacterium]
MTEERRTERATPAQGVGAGWIVGVTPSGRLEWIVPETSAEQASVPEGVQDTAVAPHGAEIISATERELIESNRRQIEELRTRPYPSPDLQDIVSDIMSRAHPTMGLAVAAWVLQATGLLPIPVAEGAAMAAGALGVIAPRLGRLHAAQVPASASAGAAQLWQTHPELAMEIIRTVIDRVISSIKQAASIDDTELEDQLDAFYPRWSRTDFEFRPQALPAVVRRATFRAGGGHTCANVKGGRTHCENAPPRSRHTQGPPDNARRGSENDRAFPARRSGLRALCRQGARRSRAGRVTEGMVKARRPAGSHWSRAAPQGMFRLDRELGVEADWKVDRWRRLMLLCQAERDRDVLGIA